MSRIDEIMVRCFEIDFNDKIYDAIQKLANFMAHSFTDIEYLLLEISRKDEEIRKLVAEVAGLETLTELQANVLKDNCVLFKQLQNELEQSRSDNINNPKRRVVMSFQCENKRLNEFVEKFVQSEARGGSREICNDDIRPCTEEIRSTCLYGGKSEA